MSINPDSTGKASGRSIKGLNLFDLLSMSDDNLLRFGGHELAAGFTVKADRADALRDTLNKNALPLLTEDVLTPKLTIDCVIDLEDINTELVNSLKVLEPYGIENPSPVFCIADVLIKSIRYTQDNKHAFITVSKDNLTIEMPAFGMCDATSDFCEGEYISVAGILNINVFRGNTKAQFIVRDIHPSKLNDIISKKELEDIFKAVRHNIEKGIFVFDRNFFVSLSGGEKCVLKSRKFDIAMKIFCELGILNPDKKGNTYVISKGENYHNKTNLDLSETYIKHKAD